MFQASQVRNFLLGLLGEAPQTEIPDTLAVLARQAGVAEREVDDVVADFLSKLWRATVNGTPGGIKDLLDLEPNVLLSVVRHRVAQSACQGPRWSALKAIRSHVRVILSASPAPPAAAELPVTIHEDGHLRRELVAKAVGAILAAANPPPRSVPAIADVLFQLYFEPRFAIDEGDHQEALQEDAVSIAHDAVVEAQRLERLLGAEDAQLLAQRAEGRTLAALGGQRGLALTTVHGHFHRARARLRRGPSFETGVAALRLLAGGGVRR